MITHRMKSCYKHLSSLEEEMWQILSVKTKVNTGVFFLIGDEGCNPNVIAYSSVSMGINFH